MHKSNQKAVFLAPQDPKNRYSLLTVNLYFDSQFSYFTIWFFADSHLQTPSIITTLSSFTTKNISALQLGHCFLIVTELFPFNCSVSSMSIMLSLHPVSCLQDKCFFEICLRQQLSKNTSGSEYTSLKGTLLAPKDSVFAQRSYKVSKKVE